MHRVIKKTSKIRPRAMSEKIRVNKDCFKEVWELIFPQATYPDLKTPPTPCMSNYCRSEEQSTDSRTVWPEQPPLPTIHEQTQALFQLMFATRAQIAVAAGRIASESDFKPTHDEYTKMLSEAVAIVIKLSKSLSSALTDSNDSSIQDAVRAVSGTSDAMSSLPSTIEDGHESSDTMERVPRSIGAKNHEDIVRPKENTSVISLQHQETEVRLRLSSTERRQELRNTLPPDTVLQGFEQNAIPPPTVATTTEFTYVPTQENAATQSYGIDQRLDPEAHSSLPRSIPSTALHTPLALPYTVKPNDLVQNIAEDTVVGPDFGCDPIDFAQDPIADGLELLNWPNFN